MTWHSPISSSAITILVLLGLAAMAASFVWSSRELRPGSPQGLTIIVLRGLAFLLLLFFVLQPYRLPDSQEVTVRKKLAVLIDTSGSMSKQDSPGVPSRLDQVRKLLADHKVFDQITSQADLAVYGFDSRASAVKPDAISGLVATGKQTDIGAAIQDIAKENETVDLAGIMLFTDGHNTQGVDPRTVATKLKVPLFPLPIGEEPHPGDNQQTQMKDLAIEAVSADPQVIVGRSAQIVVSVSGKGYPSRQVTVELLENDSPIGTSAVAISPQQPRRQALFTITPATIGAHQYRVRIPLEPGESNTINNAAAFKIDVIDPVNRLIYLDRLRSERKFLKPLLETRKSLRFTAIVQQDEKRVLVDGNDSQMKKEAANFSDEQLNGIKAVILGDLPASALTPAQIASLVKWVDRGGALMFLAGPASMGEHGLITTPLAKVLPINAEGGARYLEQDFPVELTPDGAAHPAFQKVKMNWTKAAPLLSRFDVTGVKPAATVLMATADDAHAPIVVSHTFGHGRTAIVLTDSTWRWQLGATAADPANSEFAIFWKQMIDWLLPEMDERSRGESQVQLIADRAEYEVNDQVVLMVSVRGADGSVVSNATVDVNVATPDGRPIHRVGKLDTSLANTGATPGGTSAGGVYTATFDLPVAGQYEVQAVARLGEHLLGSDQVSLKATQPVIEFAQTDPDRPLLHDLAKLTGGVYLEPASLDRIVELAKLEPRKVQVQPNSEKDAMPVWDRWWLGLILLGLMGSEWALRKKNQWV